VALVVFTGGARSGKSALAQDLARVRRLDGARVVVVVFGDGSRDREMARRIERHRNDRPADLHVVEASDSQSWLESIADGTVVLVDCLGTLVTRALDEAMSAGDIDVATSALCDVDELSESLETDVETRVRSVLDALIARLGDTIVVTNEVGDGVVPAFASGRLFRDVLGRANRRLVQAADAAYLVVCGRAIELSALPVAASWPEDELSRDA